MHFTTPYGAAARCGRDRSHRLGLPGRLRRIRLRLETAGANEKIGVSLITKDSSKPFFVAMQKGAKEEAGKKQRRPHRRLRQGRR